MFTLAFNLEGEPIEVPASAVAWQVRRSATRDRSHVVYAADGLPLLFPLDTGIEDLRAAAKLDGRYRLVPVDEGRRQLDGTAYA